MRDTNENNSDKVLVKKTEGKKLGLIAFVISELLVMFVVVVFVIGVLTTETIDYTIIRDLLLFQGTIFAVTWGAKASSNFAKKG